MNPKIKRIIYWIVALLLFLTALIIILSSKPDVDYIKSVIISQGLLGPFVIILIDAISIIVSPLTSFPLWISSLAIFGFLSTVIFICIGNNIGNISAFLIAKHFGRPLVEKLVGKVKMTKVDEFVDIIGIKPLFIIRLFGGAASDYISYAAGLTKIGTRTYFLINLIATWPSILFQLLILEKTISVNPVFFIAFVIWGYLAALGLSIYFYKKNKPKN